MLDIPIEKMITFDEIKSIDEAALALDNTLENSPDNYHIPSEIEFWGHCSNLQVWAENNYNTNLLHSNLAFPLLRRLTEAGDMVARKSFKEEIARRFSSNFGSVRIFLLNEGYLEYLKTEEIKSLIDEDEMKHLIDEHRSDYEFYFTYINAGRLYFRLGNKTEVKAN